MSDEKWKSFSLTHVMYKEGDNLGCILAILSLAPIAIIVAFITLVLFRRDLHTILFFVGQLGNETLNQILKRWWKEPRPDLNSAEVHAGARFGKYGMPSAHAQFVTFFTIYSSLFLIFRLRSNSNGKVVYWKVLVMILLHATSALICYGRVYLGHHWLSQVLCGCAIGSVVGIMWFLMVDNAFTPLFPKIVSWRISEKLLIRDTSVIPHILFFEYTSARSETRVRSRKQSSKHL